MPTEPTPPIAIVIAKNYRHRTHQSETLPEKRRPDLYLAQSDVPILSTPSTNWNDFPIRAIKPEYRQLLLTQLRSLRKQLLRTPDKRRCRSCSSDPLSMVVLQRRTKDHSPLHWVRFQREDNLKPVRLTLSPKRRVFCFQNLNTMLGVP